MSRIVLTERRIAALQPDPTGKRRVEQRDALVPSLIVRVASRKRVYCLHSRFPKSRNPTRRVIGEVGAISLDDARQVARDWLALLRQGIDPADEVRARRDAAREAARVASAQRFGAVAAQYLARKQNLRQIRSVTRIIQNELVARWFDRPITSISRRDVIAMLEEIDARGASVYAAACFTQARVLFGWAVARDLIPHSPCADLKASAFLSRTKAARQRTLNDAEIAALWTATGNLDQPCQSAFRLLLLTGVRKTECLGATWAEFSDLDDPAKALWRIPAARYKSGSEHLVPLSPAACEVLAAVPRGKRGPYVFSCTGGLTPALIVHQAKQRLDELMRRDLPDLKPWQTHDLRRVLKSTMSRLQIADHISELALGHARRGLQATYDKWSHQPAIRQALNLYAAEIARIVDPDRGGATVLPWRSPRQESA